MVLRDSRYVQRAPVRTPNCQETERRITVKAATFSIFRYILKKLLDQKTTHQFWLKLQIISPQSVRLRGFFHFQTPNFGECLKILRGLIANQGNPVNAIRVIIACILFQRAVKASPIGWRWRMALFSKQLVHVCVFGHDLAQAESLCVGRMGITKCLNFLKNSAWLGLYLSCIARTFVEAFLQDGAHIGHSSHVNHPRPSTAAPWPSHPVSARRVRPHRPRLASLRHGRC